MKELKVYAGTSEEHMSEILHAGLKNDTIPETFILNHINKAGVIFPTQFVKIVPLMYVLSIIVSSLVFIMPQGPWAKLPHIHMACWTRRNR
jgi:hypothetical protein